MLFGTVLCVAQRTISLKSLGHMLLLHLLWRLNKLKSGPGYRTYIPAFVVGDDVRWSEYGW